MPLALAEDTIVAIASPPGRGALAVVRLSGPAALAIARRVIAPWPSTSRRATLAAICDPTTGALIDRAVVTVYHMPASYTGEDLVEISSHGGSVVPPAVMKALVQSGARPALPGEFTRRAVLNGKMDILQAEAVADLVDARSTAMHGAALAQLDGGLSRRIEALRSALLDLEALLAYDIDFPEEDDGPVPAARIDTASANLVASLTALAATAATGQIIRDGALVAIVGEPNVGKSSLFNALLGQPRAIVSDVPGTTRDAIEAVLDPGTVPLRLADTAGLRQPGDALERLGIDVSERYLREAQLVLACGDTPDSRRVAIAHATRLTDVPLLIVATKCDTAPGGMGAPDVTGHERHAVGASLLDAHPVSAETGFGLPALVDLMEQQLVSSYSATGSDSPILTRARHRLAIERASAELTAFRAAWFDGHLPAPVAATHLRTAIVALEDLIGAVEIDDILDRVFSTFCIGK